MITGASAAAGYPAAPVAMGRLPGSGTGAPAQLDRPGKPEQPGASRKVEPASSFEKTKPSEKKLTEEQKRQVQTLKRRDTQVRAHENAHSAAGGSYTSAPSYQFTTGPDGKRYATGGEVQIDSSPVRGNPRATMRKMDVVIRAATAPADPSSQDLAVARKAQAERSKASAEVLKSPESAGSGATAPPEPGTAPQPPGAPPEPGGAAPVPGATASSASRLLEGLAAYGEQSGSDKSAALAQELANLAAFA